MGKFFKGIKNKLAAVTTLTMALAVSAFAGAAAASPPSQAVDFSNMSGLTVDPLDVVSTGFSFMRMFDNYTVIVLGLIFAPVAVGFVLWIWGKLPKMGSKRSA